MEWKNPEDLNTNVSRVHHGGEFLILAAGLLGLAFLGYFFLGLLADYLVIHISPAHEKKLGALWEGTGQGKNVKKSEEALQTMVDRLSVHVEPKIYTYHTKIVCAQDANAFAIPGGRIIVFDGLLREASSENEILMVLAHELGHFHHRHHLRGLGRGLVFSFFASLIASEDSMVMNLVNSASTWMALKFNRDQESEADAFAVDLLVKTTGHAGGAVDFFQRMSMKRADSTWASWFRSHPASDDRVAKIQALIEKNGWAVKETLNLSPESLVPDCK